MRRPRRGELLRPRLGGGRRLRGADRLARRSRRRAERRVRPSSRRMARRLRHHRSTGAARASSALDSPGHLIFPLVPTLVGRDRAATLAILENAQWVYALGRYPKKQVLDDPSDVKMLAGRIGAMRKAAGELSAAQKKKVDVPWATLEYDPDETPDMLWTMAKKVVPKVIAELRPLVSDTPEAAFLISPEPKKATPKKMTATARKKRKK